MKYGKRIGEGYSGLDTIILLICKSKSALDVPSMDKVRQSARLRYNLKGLKTQVGFPLR